MIRQGIEESEQWEMQSLHFNSTIKSWRVSLLTNNRLFVSFATFLPFQRDSSSSDDPESREICFKLKRKPAKQMNVRYTVCFLAFSLFFFYPETSRVLLRKRRWSRLQSTGYSERYSRAGHAMQVKRRRDWQGFEGLLSRFPVETRATSCWTQHAPLHNSVSLLILESRI
jgi:hypothetical protein